MNREQLLLYFIMGTNNSAGSPLRVLTNAIEGGVTCFQFREKGQGALEGAEKEQAARDMQAICRKHGVPFIVNDDIELALELQADGIHVGQDDESIEAVRKKCPDYMIVGVSAKTVNEAAQAQKQGADYIGTGPMFSTTTKADAKSPIGPGAITELRENGIDLPVVGIGGIKKENASEVIRAGADGVSVISSISMDEDPKQAARLLKNQLT
ncbi:thiamine-phosphate diphosphorylase [Alteribacillus persepolensis]|uniref:Thiamine-phosphate synthase n=1 Tax=Alteribacillus persepolensis TaxID=568899 RepID=A0A1G8FJS2_9BACI|nr:thiamine phosphate synthase [Alteribacillus persepolensis]SDH82374.1 thiamine-phosphate diphosphorylase [Alteribacillus persepolensis]